MSEKSPWWQKTKTVRQGVWLGCGFAIAGLSEVTLAAIGRVNLPMLIIGAGFSAIGLTHLTSVAAVRRRQRASSTQDGHPGVPGASSPTLDPQSRRSVQPVRPDSPPHVTIHGYLQKICESAAVPLGRETAVRHKSPVVVAAAAIKCGPYCPPLCR